MDNNIVNQLVSDGFSFARPDADFTELALLSLKIALQSFTTTYRSVQYSLASLENPRSLNQEEIDSLHTSNYRQMYAETIVHFQHFAELVCKDFLRKEHPLLSVDASPKPLIFHKLLRGEPVNSSDWEGLKSIEFSEALERLGGLISGGRLPPGLGFITQYDYCLQKLNLLRNRIWHRGTFVLRYKALDQLVIGCLLPFVQEILALPEYSSRDDLWKYQSLACGLDPISILIADARAGSYDIRKVAFLKELLRAAYENPLRPEQGFGKNYIADKNAHLRQRANQLAEAKQNQGDVEAVRSCPVCGIDSLILYSNTEPEGDPMEPERIWLYTYEAECMCCSFTIEHSLQNPRAYGLDVDDYWYAVDLGSAD